MRISSPTFAFYYGQRSVRRIFGWGWLSGSVGLERGRREWLLDEDLPCSITTVYLNQL